MSSRWSPRCARPGHEVLVVGPGFYQQAAFGAESRLVAWIRARLPAALGEVAELAYNLPAYRRLRAPPDRSAPRSSTNVTICITSPARCWRGGCDVPFYLEVNAPIADERTRFGGLRLRRLARRLEAWTWRAATRVVAVTGVLKSMIAAAGVPIRNGSRSCRMASIPPRSPTCRRARPRPIRWCWASSASSATGTGWMR